MNIRREYEKAAAQPWWQIIVSSVTLVLLPGFWLFFPPAQGRSPVFAWLLAAGLVMGLVLVVPTTVLKLRSRT